VKNFFEFLFTSFAGAIALIVVVIVGLALWVIVGGLWALGSWLWSLVV